jgi:hypothetical protein
MATIDQKILELIALRGKLERVQDQWLKSEDGKKFAGDVVAQITKRTRLGKGVAQEGGEYEPISGLEGSTIKTRKRYQKNLSEFTRPKKSNLTATGQMLEAITYRIQQGGFLFFFKSGRRNRELSGGPGKTSNAEVARHVGERRPFFNLSRSEMNGYAVRLKREILKLIRGQ